MEGASHEGRYSEDEVQQTSNNDGDGQDSMSSSNEDRNSDGEQESSDEHSDETDNEEAAVDRDDLASELFEAAYQEQLRGGYVTLAQHLVSKTMQSLKNKQTRESFQRNLLIENLSIGGNIPVKKFMKLLKSMEEEGIVYKFFCKCGALVCTSKAEKMKEVRGKLFNCGSESCKGVKVDLSGNSADVLAVLDVRKQIENIYQNVNIEKMIEPLEEIKQRNEIMYDIYDGYQFKKVMSKKYPEDILLIHSSDGLQIFESGVASVWTHLYLIANLKPFYRHNPNFMVLGSVIFCKKGQPPRYFFRDNLEEEVLKFDSYVIPWRHENEAKMSTVDLLFSINDLPARSKIFECPYFNARNGCSFCKIEGKSFKKGLGQNIYFPANINENLESKTNTEVRQWGIEAEATGEKVNGYSGESAFSKLPHFDLVEQNVLDKMHCLYEGQMKSLLRKWFEESVLMPYTIKLHMDRIQERIDGVHLTSETSRTTLKIREYKHWKASQLRTFSLIGPTVLPGILAPTYFNHFCKFSNACHILESDGIGQPDLLRAENLLDSFWSEQPYQENFVTQNMHAVGHHVAQSVHNWGPCHSTSMFPEENVNNVFKAFVTGNVGVTSQLAQKWNLNNNLGNLATKLNGDNPVAKAMYELACGTPRLVDPIVTPVGVIMSSSNMQTKKRRITGFERNSLSTSCHKDFPNESEVYESTKIRVDKHVVTSVRYKEGISKKKWDFMVIARIGDSEETGAIEYFLTPLETLETFCAVSLFENAPSNTSVTEQVLNSEAKHCRYMRKCENRPLILCPLSDLIGKCIIIQEPPNFFVVKVPTLKSFE